MASAAHRIAARVAFWEEVATREQPHPSSPRNDETGPVPETVPEKLVDEDEEQRWVMGLEEGDMSSVVQEAAKSPDSSTREGDTPRKGQDPQILTPNEKDSFSRLEPDEREGDHSQLATLFNQLSGFFGAGVNNADLQQPFLRGESPGLFQPGNLNAVTEAFVAHDTRIADLDRQTIKLHADVSKVWLTGILVWLMLALVTLGMTCYGYSLHQTNLSTIANLSERLSTLPQDDTTKHVLDAQQALDKRTTDLEKSLAQLMSSMPKYMTQEELGVLLNPIQDDVAQIRDLADKLNPQVSALQVAGRATEDTASEALTKAGTALSAVKGVCFPKSRLNPCPPGSNETTLWHWYYPDNWDPYCGGAGHDVTQNAVDGTCGADALEHLVTSMKGCCRSS